MGRTRWWDVWMGACAIVAIFVMGLAIGGIIEHRLLREAAAERGTSVGKGKEYVQGWEGCDEFIGAGDLTVLSGDGESVIFAVAGGPVGMTSSRFKTDSKRALIPIVTVDGLSIFPASARTYRKLSRKRASFAEQAVVVTRRGAPGDTDTYYDVDLVPLGEDLVALREKVTKKEIEDAISNVLEILQTP